MKRPRPTIRSARTGTALCLLLVLAIGLLVASPAWAGYQEVGTFGKGELDTASGLAVNASGAGGVAPGTVYSVTEGGHRVARYGPEGQFLEAWGWGVAEGAPEAEFQRCGPAGEPSHPTCKRQGSSATGEGPGKIRTGLGIAVDQATGDVYVLDGERQNGVVQVFSPDGSELVSRFGERGAPGETIAEGPGKIHEPRVGGIAVSDTGIVYVTDRKFVTPGSPGEELRVMTFQGGIYTGRSHDVAAPHAGVNYDPGWLAVDSAGDLYTSNEVALFEFSPGEPTTPACTFELPSGGMRGMTVDPSTAEAFYFDFKGKKTIHQLGACNSQAEFPEVGSIEVTPKTESIEALAFNPALSYSAGRPPGVLYAADAATRSEGGQTVFGLGHILAQPISHPPSIESESVSSVGLSSASLQALINPNGEATEYAFQYLADAAYQANESTNRFAGANEVPIGGASVGDGSLARAVSASLSGLSPGTTYHFRAVANNSDGTVPGSGATFQTFPAEAAGLPDGRAYELVSPAGKHGGEVIPLNPEQASCGSECKPGAASQAFPRQISSDGDRIVYEGFSFSPSEGAAVYNEYISERTATGWQTTNLSPALMGSNLQGYKAFNGDLTEGALYQMTPSLADSAPAEYPNIYLQLTADPLDLSPLLTSPPEHRSAGKGSEGLSLAYAGASADFSRIFFAANDALPGVSPAAVDGGPSKKNLYESSAGNLKLINVLPGNSVTVPGAYFGAKAQAQGETSDLSNAISSDGQRAFWSSESGQVYVRIDSDSGERTEELPDHGGRFLTASADGSRVLLTDGLVYDVDDLAKPPIDLTESHGGFEGIAGQSEDLSSIYFVDTEVLNELPNSQGAVAKEGESNLYLWHGGSGATFIATLANADNVGNRVSGTWTASPANRTAEASPDGRWLAFLSRARVMTKFDNTGACLHTEAGVTNGPCAEVYLYDSSSGTLSCPSCNPSGEPPHGRSNLSLLSLNPEAQEAPPQPRYLGDSGRLYFDSQDSLSAFDTNGAVEDVYEFEPQGQGTCVKAAGCVFLISAGREPFDSNFVAADPSGSNVFFTTRDQLVPQDKDALVDLYDAREEGGFAVEPERSECRGEACQRSTSLPAESAPGSSIVGAETEESQAKCHKGQVKRKGRCVAKRHKKTPHKKKTRHKKRRNRNGRSGASRSANHRSVTK